MTISDVKELNIPTADEGLSMEYAKLITDKMNQELDDWV